MMETADTSETSVNFYQTTRRNSPDDSHLQTRLFIKELHNLCPSLNVVNVMTFRNVSLVGHVARMGN
jgi:hypothetical protein